MHVIWSDCLLTHPIERLLNACHPRRLSTHASYRDVTECMSSEAIVYSRILWRGYWMHVIWSDCLLTHPMERLLNACHLKRLSTHASYGEVTECMSSEAIGRSWGCCPGVKLSKISVHLGFVVIAMIKKSGRPKFLTQAMASCCLSKM